MKTSPRFVKAVLSGVRKRLELRRRKPRHVFSRQNTFCAIHLIKLKQNNQLKIKCVRDFD
jgi:hypothetical protein